MKDKKSIEISDLMQNVQSISDIAKISNQIDGDKIISVGCLEPGLNMNNSNRNIMWTAHFAQTPVLANDDKPEVPLVFTSYENQVGKYSSGYKKAKEDYEVVAKIVKNKFKYYLIVRNNDDKYDIIERTECVNRTENYGWKLKNNIDALDEGDIIEKDDVLYANTSYDDYMNLCFGKNVLAVYYANRDKTHEDCCLVSERLGKKFKFNLVSEVKLTLNTNDILLNIYGDNENYKCFPDIGEDIVNQELCIRRRIKYDNLLIDLKDIKHYKNGDDVFYKKGKIVDINIFCNNDIEKLSNAKYYNQIVSYLNQDKAFYEEVVERLQVLVEEYTDDCSIELVDFYNDCKMRLDENNYYVDDGTKFDNIVIKFTILYEKPVTPGCKFTGRYGNKGVSGEVVPDVGNNSIEDVFNDDMEFLVIPDSEMPIVEEGPFKGLQADICLNPLGVNNRKNYFQLFEQEINFIGLYVRKAIHDTKDLREKENLLLTFYEKLERIEQKKITREYLSTLKKKEKEHFFDLIVKEGIPVKQGPMSNHLDIYSLNKFQEYYEKTLNVQKFKFKGIHERMVMGELYFLILKHSPDNKNSIRSTNFLDLKDTPSKDREYKQGKSLYAKTPVKLGEQEVIGLMNLDLKDYKIVKEFKDAYGLNQEAEELLERNLLLGDPFNININFPKTESKNIKIGRELIYCLGAEVYHSEDNTIEEPKEIISEKRKQLEEKANK